LFAKPIQFFLYFALIAIRGPALGQGPCSKSLRKDPSQAPEQLRRIKIDTYFGMATSNLVAFFIMLTSAATLHAHGQTNIQTATEAAQALEPLAGRFA
jgi:Mn2+/Fe2+ NRAMP family transporter